MLDQLERAAKAANLKLVVVPDLGRDAVVLTRYGLLLIDAAAAESRADSLCDWLRAG